MRRTRGCCAGTALEAPPRRRGRRFCSTWNTPGMREQPVSAPGEWASSAGAPRASGPGCRSWASMGTGEEVAGRGPRERASRCAGQRRVRGRSGGRSRAFSGTRWRNTPVPAGRRWEPGVGHVSGRFVLARSDRGRASTRRRAAQRGGERRLRRRLSLATCLARVRRREGACLARRGRSGVRALRRRPPPRPTPGGDRRRDRQPQVGSAGLLCEVNAGRASAGGPEGAHGPGGGCWTLA